MLKESQNLKSVQRFWFVGYVRTKIRGRLSYRLTSVYEVGGLSMVHCPWSMDDYSLTVQFFPQTYVRIKVRVNWVTDLPVFVRLVDCPWTMVDGPWTTLPYPYNSSRRVLILSSAK